MTAQVTTNETWVLSGALLELAECGEKEMVSEILDVFVADAGAKTQALQPLVESSNFSEIGRIAHSLKGAARQIGLEDLASIAEQLERGAAGNSGSVAQAVTILTLRWAKAKQAVEAVRDSL